jgi:hypothetical protein
MSTNNNNSNTNIFQSPKPQPKKPMPNHDSILEAFRDLGSGVKQGVKDDVIGKGLDSAFQSLLGQMPRPGEHRRSPFERHPFGRRETPQPVHRPEILSPQKISEEQEKTKQQLEAVRAELSMLAKSVGKLHQEIEKAVMDVPVDPGVYHINFLERLRMIIHLIRKRVDDSSEWLQMTSSRKKQKTYWGLYKKHGTKFGLSADRTPQTQTG